MLGLGQIDTGVDRKEPGCWESWGEGFQVAVGVRTWSFGEDGWRARGGLATTTLASQDEGDGTKGTNGQNGQPSLPHRRRLTAGPGGGCACHPCGQSGSCTCLSDDTIEATVLPSISAPKPPAFTIHVRAADDRGGTWCPRPVWCCTTLNGSGLGADVRNSRNGPAQRRGRSCATNSPAGACRESVSHQFCFLRPRCRGASTGEKDASRAAFALLSHGSRWEAETAGLRH